MYRVGAVADGAGRAIAILREGRREDVAFDGDAGTTISRLYIVIRGVQFSLARMENMALSKTTQNHDEIQQWAEARGAVPAEVSSTEKNGQTGILRFEFPGAKNAKESALNEISWDEFFEKFDASGLSLVYQDKTTDGEKSNFNKLVYPENAKPAVKQSSGKSARKTASKKAPAKKSAAKKTAAKKTTAKKTAPKKTAPKKTATKKTGTKKTGTKKTAAKTDGKSARSSSGRKSTGRK